MKKEDTMLAVMGTVFILLGIGLATIRFLFWDSYKKLFLRRGRQIGFEQEGFARLPEVLQTAFFVAMALFCCVFGAAMIANVLGLVGN